MEKYEKPVMEVVDIQNDMILTSGCSRCDGQGWETIGPGKPNEPAG